MNDAQQELLSYVEWLIAANKRTTGASDLTSLSQCYLWGTISEVYELITASEETKISEAGDVLAYGVLALHSLGESNSTIATNFSRTSTVPSAVHVMAPLTNALAKLYRGDEGNYKQQAIAHLYNLVHWAATVTSVPVLTLSYINKQKLEARLSNTGTFKGSGDR